MKPTGKSLPPKKTGRFCLYLQGFFFLPKPGGAGHELAPRQVVCIRDGLSVEDQPTMYRGRPLPEPKRQLDCTKTCCQHLRGEFTPTKAAPKQNQAAQAAALASTQGTTAAVTLAERLLLSSSQSFLHHLPTTGREQGEGMDTFSSGFPPHLRSQEGNVLGKDSWKGCQRALI